MIQRKFTFLIGRLAYMKKVRKILFRLFIVLFVILVLFFSLFYAALNNLSFISKKFLNRDLTYSKLTFSLLNGKLEADDIVFSTPSQVELLKIKKVIIDLDILKILTLKPVISLLYIDELETYAIKENNSYNFPKYLDFKSSGKKFDIPLSILHTEVKNSTIKLKEGDQYSPLIKEINIFLPEIKKIGELKPEISARIGERVINLKGKVNSNDERTSVEFNLKLSKFNLKEISFLIPPINNIKILSGRIDSDIFIVFEIDKKKKQRLIVAGDISFTGLNLYDLKIQKEFVKRVQGSLRLNEYNIFEKYLEIDKFNIETCDIDLYFSKESDNNSAVIPKMGSKKSNFRFYNRELNIKKLNLYFNDMLNNYSYNASLSGKLREFTTFKDNDFNFKINLKNSFIESLDLEGSYNLKNRILDLNKIILSEFDAAALPYIKDKLKDLKSLKIKTFQGKLFLSNDTSYISGKTDVKELVYYLKSMDNNIILKGCYFDLIKYDFKNSVISLNELKTADLTFPLSKDNNVVSNLSFNLPTGDNYYVFRLITIGKVISFNDKIRLEKINGSFKSDDYNFDFNVKDFLLTPDIEFDRDAKNIKGKFDIKLKKALLSYMGDPVFKIDSFQGLVDKIVYPDTYISFKTLSLDASFANLLINEDKKLYLFSFFDLFKSNKGKKNLNSINIDNLDVKIGDINFKDLSLKNKFEIDLNNVNCIIKNYPSTVYPEGVITLSGNMNNINNFNIEGTIGSETGFKGNFSTSSLLLQDISPMVENYIGYSLINGILDLYADINIFDETLNIETKMKLKNLKLQNRGSKIKLDLQDIIERIEDGDGLISLQIPIKGKLNKPNVDLRKVFFDLFVDMVSNSTKDFSQPVVNFKDDGTYEVVYFKAGQDEMVNQKNIFSDDMITKFGDKRKVFIIQGYVDRIKDTLNLKNEILTEKIILYNSEIPQSGSSEEIFVLRKIYKSYTNEDTDETNNDLLKQMVLEKINIPENNFYLLSYKRVKKIKEILTEVYGIPEERIIVEEKDIFNNGYIEGVGNSIGIVLSGDKID